MECCECRDWLTSNFKCSCGYLYLVTWACLLSGGREEVEIGALYLHLGWWVGLCVFADFSVVSFCLSVWVEQTCECLHSGCSLWWPWVGSVVLWEVWMTFVVGLCCYGQLPGLGCGALFSLGKGDMFGCFRVLFVPSWGEPGYRGPWLGPGGSFFGHLGIWKYYWPSCRVG